MALKNKDGSVYKLKSPNPLTRKQDKAWDAEKIVLHNFKWKETKVDDIPSLSSKTPIIEDRSEPEPEAVIPPVVETIKVETPEPQPESRFKVKVWMYCLPIKLDTFKDNLYGDTYQKRSYGEKFAFESIMVETSDMAIRFWTSSEANLTSGSIVYPYQYNDGQKYGEFRWWAIQAIEEKAGGLLVEATPSVEQPDFS